MKHTPEDVRKLVDYDAATGALTWRARPPEMFARKEDFTRWNKLFQGKPAFNVARKRGYFGGKLGGQYYYAHRVAFAWMAGRWPEGVDHINGDPGDNRWQNLRECDPAQNQWNAVRSTGTSKHKGVHWQSRDQRWYAVIKRRGKATYLGSFRNEDDAVAAYQAAALAMHGEYAVVLRNEEKRK